ncbi:MAG: HD domain-containing protein, partial [Armatimonadetes bacterium]|nr:HD domain-containing protein [Armatimonadota bacterium]
HLHRIQHLCVALARALRLPAGLVAELGYASMLHDVGKLHVPDHILRKPGPLTTEEWEVIRQHPLQGVRILGRHPAFSLAREIALAHHEKWDGSGYPEGLSGESIPLSARLMAVADVYDALISKRVYKQAFSHEKAVAIIQEGRGAHFDPTVVDAFEQVSQQFRVLAEEWPDSDEEVARKARLGDLAEAAAPGRV